MNSQRAIWHTVNALRGGMVSLTEAHVEVTVSTEQAQAQMAALMAVISRLAPEPKPDANGWIARATLR